MKQDLPIWKAFLKINFSFSDKYFLVLASGYFVYGWMMQVGVDQDYEPVQPIHFHIEFMLEVMV